MRNAIDTSEIELTDNYVVRGLSLFVKNTLGSELAVGGRFRTAHAATVHARMQAGATGSVKCLPR